MSWRVQLLCIDPITVSVCVCSSSHGPLPVGCHRGVPVAPGGMTRSTNVIRCYY